MKRSEPLRRTPLARSREARIRPLRRASMDPAVRHAVFVRAGGRCERCRRPLPGDAWDAHHRQLRSRGGEDTVANLVALCRADHRWVHENPRDATAAGLMVPSWDDPTTTPLHMPGTGWVLLGDSYTLTPSPEGATP